MAQPFGIKSATYDEKTKTITLVLDVSKSDRDSASGNSALYATSAGTHRVGEFSLTVAVYKPKPKADRKPKA